MTSELCMHCFSVKGINATCPYCGYVEGTPPEQAFHLTPGTVLTNRYLIGTCIGFGGFGIIYKAYDTVLGVIVAIKEFYPVGLVNRAPGECQIGVLSGEKMAEYNTQLKRFLLEAQSVAQFSKAKDIVNVYDYFEENGTAYIVMEYIDGVLLKEYIEQEGKLDVDIALYLIMPIIEALKKIHGSGIIHRDVSPDNIFITHEGAIKIFDFGAAQFAGESGETASETVIKAGYAAPEQYRAKSSQGPASDIYSVGAILYEMLTGVKPMEASDRTAEDTLVPPSQLGIQLSPNLDRAIMQAMAIRQEYRFQYVEHLQEAIEEKRVAEYPEERRKRLRRKRHMAITIALSSIVACIVVALALVRWTQRGNQMLTTPLTECELTIWVPYEGSQTEKEAVSQMELLINDYNSNSNSFPGNEKVTIQCAAIEADEYAEQLENAKKEGNAPDIYCTDFAENTDALALNELYDLLEKQAYCGLSKYIERNPEMKSVPFGLRTLCAYTFTDSGTGGVMDIKEILTEENKKKIYVDGRVLGNVLALQDASLLSGNPVEMYEKSAGNYGVLNEYANVLGLSTSSIWGIKGSQSIMDVLTDSSDEKQEVETVIADTDFNKVLYNYNSENYDKKIEYQRKLLTMDGSAIMEYRDTYAVNAELSKDPNKAMAAQRFLYLCMSQTENTVYYSGTSRVIPSHVAAWSSGGTYTDSLLETLAKEKITPIFAEHYAVNNLGKKVLEESTK